MLFASDYLYEDTRDELRAEARAERARYRLHWCRDCLGHTGPGSPCREDAPEQDEQEQDE